jgi:hypothetical protein
LKVSFFACTCFFMKNSNRRVIKTRSIGSIAFENLSREQDASIFGVTSQGIYLKTSSKWLVFLSFDQFRGPLTLTLEDISPSLNQASTRQAVHIASRSLSFPDLDMMITFQGSEVWRPDPIARPVLVDAERYANMVRITQEVLSKKSGIGLSQLLPPLLGLPNTGPNSVAMRGFDRVEIQQLQNHIRNGEADPLARQLTNVLGCGAGLTPSADDFVMGLLLTLNRCQIRNWSDGTLRELNHQVLEAAYAKTTSLSANLIECAALGSADERLTNALDWLVSGVPREPEIVDHLIRWGNSSGVDAFAGMVVTLSA